MSGQGTGDWVVVKHKAEQSRQLRGSKDESIVFPSLQMETGQKADLNYHTLVGAPIRLETYHQDADITNKIGDSLHLAASDVSNSLMLKSATKPTQSNMAIDLSDTGEWPSMGIQGGVGPQLGLWTAIVKKPVVPVAPQVNHYLNVMI